MIKFKHTSGKWVVGGEACFITPRGQYDIAFPDVKNGSRTQNERDSQRKANEKLIASAPEMLESMISQNKRILSLREVPKITAEQLLSDIFYENYEIIKNITGLTWEEIIKDE